MLTRPETQYATTVDGFSIAYQVFGEGPLNIVMVPGIVSHVELRWETPGLAAFSERFGSLGRVAVFDKRGTGLSDHRIGASTLEQRLDDIAAVMDAAEMDRAALCGMSEGGSMAILFSATFPDRVTHLMLHGCLAVGVLANDRVPEERREAIGREIVRDVEQNWGTHGTPRIGFARFPEHQAALVGRFERFTASPSTAAELMHVNLLADVRPVLPAVSAPTLITHCTGDPIVPLWHGRYLAQHIRGARLVEIAGDWHSSWIEEDLALVADECERFLTGHVVPPAEPDRVLATMLFTDIADSTATAAALGDAQWQRRLEAHDRIVEATVMQWRGELVKNMGDGVLAVFDGPGRAIECARALRDALAQNGLAIRAGVHTGEVARRAGDLAGIAVHIAARVQQAAVPGEILVSPTVPGLVAGAGFEFEDRGEHELKGVPGVWRLAAVR